MKWLLGLLLLGSLKCFAYPEMIRHHYVNCTSCHVSPSGGGALTPYGRQMTSAVLSTWGSEKEAGFLHGAIDPEVIPTWLHLGGNVRAIQVHQETSQFKMGRFIRMQAGVEVGATVGPVTAMTFIGKQEPHEVRSVSPRYFVMYRLSDELTLRAGRFLPVFGLNIPEHSFPTRKPLGFDQGSERDQVEWMWSGEKWNWALTASESVPASTVGEKEKAVSGQLNYTFQDSYRMGVSSWVGSAESRRREIYAVHAVLGITEHLYYLTEFDWQKVTRPQTSEGLFHFSKLGYEIWKGFHGILYEDYSKANLSEASTLANSYGIGANFYPRPHFEFETLWTKKRITAISEEYGDYAFLMMHYYF